MPSTMQFLNRRNFLTGAAVGTASLLTRGVRAQEKPSKLIHSSYGGDYGKWIKEAYEEPFTAKTGIPIDNDIGANPERLAKLRTFKDQPRFQFINLQDRFLFEAASEGLLEDIDYSNVPNAVDVEPAFKQPKWLSHTYDLVGMIYNSNNVKTPPRNWEDLLDDRYKGRIFIDDFSHFGMHIVVAIAKANGGGYENIKPGLEFMRKIKDRLKPRFISTSQEGAKLLADGEVDVAMWQSSRVFSLKAEGKPINYATPETGDVIVSYGNGIVKNGGAKKWVEMVLNNTVDPVLQAQFISGKIIEYPSNTKTAALLPPKIKELLARPAKDNKFALDYAEVLPRLNDWTDLWNRMIAS